MSGSFRPSSVAWVAVPLCAFAFLIGADIARIRRVDFVSGAPGWAIAGESDTTARSLAWPTRLIVPGHDTESFEWMQQTRQMLEHGPLRVRRVEYENAPLGREDHAGSPYRWMLGLVAWADHARSGRPLAASVERAALFTDPLVHMLLLAGAATFVAWQLGVFPAALLSVGLVALYPFASEFLPGAPDDHGLAQACALWSILPLLAGIAGVRAAEADPARRARRWFLVAGVAGGLGVWVSVVREVPILLGIELGALLAAALSQGDTAGAAAGRAWIAPWRTWAVAGGVTCLASYLVEFFPGNMGLLQLRTVHPLYGIAWLGAGEVLAQAQAWIQRSKREAGPPATDRVLNADTIAAVWQSRRKAARSRRDNTVAALALLGMVAVPAAMWRTGDLGFMGLDLPALRLTRLAGGPAATGLLSWARHDGLSAALVATLLPLAVVGAAIWLIAHRSTGPGARASACIALGPVLVALGFACRELAWWNGADAALLALAVAVASAFARQPAPRRARLAFAGAAALVLLPGALLLVPRSAAGARSAFDEHEAVGLIERDLARWLALHADRPGPVVLAPFSETAPFYYYAGLRGIATLGWENRDGLEAATRIAAAPSPEDALEGIRQREVEFIVLPSWDTRLEAHARAQARQPDDAFIERLRRWNLPTWLRPVVYPAPRVAGYEGLSVAVFRVVEDQDEATAQGRLAEYFSELNETELAAGRTPGFAAFPPTSGPWRPARRSSSPAATPAASARPSTSCSTASRAGRTGRSRSTGASAWRSSSRRAGSLTSRAWRSSSASPRSTRRSSGR